MIKEQLIPLLAAALGKAPPKTEGLDAAACLPLAQAHGVANLLYYALPLLPQQQQPTAQTRQVMKQLAFAAATREALQQKELDTLLALFEEEKIAVLPLKGCVVKQLYPKPEMRFMSDTDLLFDASRAQDVRAIFERLGFTVFLFNQKDTDVYISPTRMNYELHRTLRDESLYESCRDFLDGLFSYAAPRADCQFVYELPWEEHYVYLLCHFVKHLLYGGIGVRQVMDIFLCRRQTCLDEEKLRTLLDRLELTEFAATLQRLGESWFADGNADEVTRELGAYILGSGSFGTNEQRVIDRMLRGQKKPNRVRYILRRVFPHYETMCFYFPRLKQAPVLLPFYWMVRLFRSVFFRRRRLSEEAGAAFGADAEALRERLAFYRRCGLKDFTKEIWEEKP